MTSGWHLKMKVCHWEAGVWVGRFWRGCLGVEEALAYMCNIYIYLYIDKYFIIYLYIITVYMYL